MMQDVFEQVLKFERKLSSNLDLYYMRRIYALMWKGHAIQYVVGNA